MSRKKSLYTAVCLLRNQGFEMSMKLHQAEQQNNSEEITDCKNYIEDIDYSIAFLLEHHNKQESK